MYIFPVNMNTILLYYFWDLINKDLNILEYILSIIIVGVQV